MQLSLSRHAFVAAFAATLCFATTTARAQYGSGFEGLELISTPAVPYAPDTWDPAAAAGTPGQDGYYWPAGTTSVPFQTQVYTGGVVTPGVNDYGIVDNPTGVAKFIVGNGPASPTFARAQRDMTYTGPAGVWTWGTDINCMFVGTLPTAQNLGSFSVQPFTGTGFIMLARWADVSTAANWNADYVWFDAADTQLTESVPNPAFQNLAVNHWYRWETDADLVTNQILEVRLIDLTAGTTATHNPLGRYMDGGSLGGVPPTGFRFFAGGGVAGNVIAYDNPCVGHKTELIPGGVASLANTLTVRGTAAPGCRLRIGVDGPTPPVTTPGQSLAGLAISLFGDPNLPNGTPLGGGITGNLLISAPPAGTLINLTPWAGPGSPVIFNYTVPANAGPWGLSIFFQGALLDLTTGAAQTTSAARVRT